MRRILDATRRRKYLRAPIVVLAGTAVVLGGAGLARATGNTDAEEAPRSSVETPRTAVEAPSSAAATVVVGAPEAATAAPARSAAAEDRSAPVNAPSSDPGEVTVDAPAPEPLDTFTGSASYYANSLAGRRTASGVPYRPNEMIAAHKTLPFGTVLRVTNLANDRTVEVRVVDRGPYAKGRILDLSRRAAEELDFIRRGHTRVKIEVLEYGEGRR